MIQKIKFERLVRSTGKRWTPRLFQKEIWNNTKGKRRNILVVPRQHGKTDYMIGLLLDAMFFYERNRNPHALVCMQTFQKVNDAYFRPISKALEQLPEDIVKMEYSKAKEKAVIFVNRTWKENPDTFILTFGSCSSEHVANNIRGATLDLLVLDEAAYYPPKIWTSVFEPMLDDTDGIAYLLSTVNGPNYFMDLDKYFERQQASGSTYYGHYSKNVYQIGLRSRDWIANRKEYLLSTGNELAWHTEYMNDYYAGVLGEYPVGEELYRRKLIVPKIQIDPKTTHLNIVIDRGKPRNMATWGWVKDLYTSGARIIYYEDNFFGLEGLIDSIYKKFNDFRSINITFPFDVRSPCILKGGVEYDYVVDYIFKNRYGHKIQTHVLNKISDKLAVWRRVNSLLPLMLFEEQSEGVGRGIEKLRRFRFKRATNSDSVILYGKGVEDGNQHAADALCHLAIDWERGMDLSSHNGVYSDVLSGLKRPKEFPVGYDLRETGRRSKTYNF